MTDDFDTPRYGTRGYQRPHCHLIATQHWFLIYRNAREVGGSYEQVRHPHMGICCTCCDYTLWLSDENKDVRMIYQSVGLAPPPNPGLPKHLRDTYWEAAVTANAAPRGAVALLRLFSFA